MKARLGIFFDELGREKRPKFPEENGPWDLDGDDYLLFALLTDNVYCPELLWEDPKNREAAGAYEVRDYQYPLFRVETNYAGFACARTTGKTESIKAKGFTHAFKRMGEDRLISAPELIHLLPLTDAIEDRIQACRLTREFLDTRGGKTGFTHRPFGVDYLDQTKLIGRIPRLTGTGVKGMHAPDVTVDEAQDYPEKGWTEIHEVVLKDHVDATGEPDFHYEFYGVHSGARDTGFYKRTTTGGFKVIQVTALQRQGWSKAEKQAAIAAYGSTSSPDYRRNIYGEPGAAASPLFVSARLIACFTPDTLVGTAGGPVRIADVREGDRVLNAAGEGVVLAKRTVRRSAVALVTLDNGEQVTCSPEHPFFTTQGWCHADRLWPGAELIGRAEALRGVWDHAQDSTDAVLFEALRRDVAWQDAGRTWAPPPSLPRVRSGVCALRGGELLFEALRGAERQCAPAAAGTALRVLRGMVPSGQGHDEAVQLHMSREDERGAQLDAARACDGRVSQEREHGRAAGPAVLALDGSRGLAGRLDPGVLDRAARGGRGGRSLFDRLGPSDEQAGRGGRRQEPSSRERARRDSGPLADRRRVASVALLQPGDREWARLCGDGDSVELVDLTVAGHPSFAVGHSSLLVHNCMDQDRDSVYNQRGYRFQEIRVEEFDEMMLPIADVLDLPAGLKAVWVGMDLGLTISPTVLMIFSEEKIGGIPRLKLVRRIHLHRMRTRQIRHALYAVGNFYGNALLGIGIDETGIGFPLFQEMEDDEIAPPLMMSRTRGYFFNSKVPVGVAPEHVTRDSQGNLRDQYGSAVSEIVDPLTGQKRFVIYMPMIEASTRYLREFVDTTYFLLPFDSEVIGDMQGDTQQRVKRIAGLKNKPNAFHILDAMRGMAMVKKAEEVDAELAMGEQQPVLEVAFDDYSALYQ